MKNLFFMGGPGFMGILTILLIITIAWIVYHYLVAVKSDQVDKEKLLQKFGYGKSMGLFSMIVGVTGQMVGLYAMFEAIEEAVQRGEEIIPALVFGGIKVTMICTIYGIIIYMLSIMLWFVANMMIEKKFK